MSPHGRPGHVVLALGAFKGSIGAADAGRALAEGLAATAPGTAVVHLPVADGGDGTLDALLAVGFQAVRVPARGPLGAPRTARTAVRGDEAFVELAEVCGLQRLAEGELQPWRSGTLGVGDAVRAVLDRGARTVRLGLGGSASTDGGLGLLLALGARVLDGDGRPCTPDARGTEAAREIDLTGLDPRLAGTTVLAVTDVDSPLSGPAGAAHVFGPQKGLGPADVERMDVALARWGRLLEQASGRSVDVPGAGAAGGVGAAVVTALGGSVVPGASYVLQAVGLDDALRGAALVVTGEGSWDAQTERGKAPHEVLRRAAAAGVPVVVVAGRVDPRVELGPAVLAAYGLLELEPDPAAAIARPVPLLVRTGARIGELLQAAGS